jgi:alpha-tubulin suppressor-like RCC1 family protein
VNDIGDLYSWGSNKEGRLGHNTEIGDIIPGARKYDFFANKYLKILEVSCGDAHIAAIAYNKNDSNYNSGDVYTWGLPMYGRLGYNDNNNKELNDDFSIKNTQIEYTKIPVLLKIPARVSRVACGVDFTACLTVSGKLYTWGVNNWGNLGVDKAGMKENGVIYTPTLVNILTNKYIIQIACGSRHMMCLTSERNVFSWGNGENGILGHGNEFGLDKPMLIKELQKEEIIYIAAGEFSSAAIDARGQLYMWGRGKYGILGLGTEDNISIPKMVIDQAFQDVKVFYVSLGIYHTLCLSSKNIINLVDSKVFAWGYSEKGRLGCIDKSECDQKRRVLSPRYNKS